MAASPAELERRATAHEADIRHIYGELADHGRQLREHKRILRDHGRQLSWLRRAMTRVMAHLGVEPPDDEEE